MMTKLQCPCTQNCNKRSATCHSECEEYLQYEKEKIESYNSYEDAPFFRNYICSVKKEQMVRKYSGK